jgi:signal transduction histidine kinase
MEVRVDTVNCVGVMEEVSGTLRPFADRKRIALELRPVGESLPLRTDRRALSQILINLVTNAIKFTDDGSVVVSMQTELIDGRAHRVFAVVDTGCGISQNEQRRLFLAFTQLDSSSTRQHEGTGLGLHLSQKLATLIGGRLTCASEVGVGSTFSLIVPE